MCIIVVKPADSNISEANLYNMWMNNPHGAGFMYAQNGELKVIKGLMTFTHFMEAYEEVADKKLVVHFRWRTHGPTTQKLTHPFWITENVGMVHNGIIPGIKAKKRESDTSTYAKVLQRRYTNPMKNLKEIRERVKVLIEIGLSKLVFMNGAGDVQILNAQMGYWTDDGCWYSNRSYTDHQTYDKVYGVADYDPENWNVSVQLAEV